MTICRQTPSILRRRSIDQWSTDDWQESITTPLLNLLTPVNQLHGVCTPPPTPVSTFRGKLSSTLPFPSPPSFYFSAFSCVLTDPFFRGKKLVIVQIINSAILHYMCTRSDAEIPFNWTTIGRESPGGHTIVARLILCHRRRGDAINYLLIVSADRRASG